MFFRPHAPVSFDEDLVDGLLERSVVEVIPSKESLKKLLLSGKRLRVKLGIDPTSPNIHLGRSVALLKMLDFEKLGHHVIPIIGDFTGVIGDTSDKESERPMLSEEVIEQNKKKYFEQAGKIIDIKKAEPRYNSEWLSKLNYHDVGEHADQFSLSDFISRELIKKRLDEGKRVSLREVLYPLMQGYDSVAVKADVELGGTDQRFNLLAGRTLQSHYKQKPQHVIILGPLLPGTDGRKMSSSWGNTINVSDSPNDMFGKIMSIPDTLIKSYFTHATRVPLPRAAEFLSGHPKDAKVALAKEIVRMYHGEKESEQAKELFGKIFVDKQVSDEVTKEIIFNEGQTYLDALVYGGSGSRTHVRRLISQGALFSVTQNKKLTDGNVEPINNETIRLGSRGFFKLVLNK